MQHQSNESGFSLLELLIVLGTMIILTSITMALMRDSVIVSNTAFELADAQQNARNAQEIISRDLRNAGHGLNDATTTISVPAAFVYTHLSKAPVAGSPMKLLISDDNIPANTTVPAALPSPAPSPAPAPIPLRPGTDRITILIADGSFTPLTVTAGTITLSGTVVPVPDPSKFKVNEIYFIYSSNGATFATVRAVDPSAKTLSFAAGDTFGLNTTGAGGISSLTNNGALACTLMRVQIIHYFVDASDRLIRRVYGIGDGDSFADSMVAEHITGLNFSYGLKRDTNKNLRAPVTKLSNLDEQDSVRRVEVSVTAEATHDVVKGIRPTVTMTASSSIRNLDGRRALAADR